MNIVGGLDRPDSSVFLYEGRTSAVMTIRACPVTAIQVIGFIFQNFNLDPSLTALENVVMPLIYAGVPRGKRVPMAETALERVGLRSRMHHRPQSFPAARCSASALREPWSTDQNYPGGRAHRQP